MPETAAKVATYARSLAHQLAVAKGPRGVAAVLELQARTRLAKGSPVEPVAVPMKELDGRRLYVRPGTSDLRNASDYYRYELYLPAPGVRDRDLLRICELGSNMGAALTALGNRYPRAALLGAEPDPDNAALARRNVSKFGTRCEVVEVGIWDEDTDLVVDRDTHYGAHGFKVRPLSPSDPPGTPSIPALSVDTLLSHHMPEGDIDYMHVSIEGTEPRVFSAGGEWARRVGSLRVEAHPELDYPAERCVAELRQLGYEAWPDPELPTKWVFAVRP